MRHRVALLAALVAAILVAAACTSGGQTSAGSRQPASASSPTANGCAGQPPVSALPTWARSGFTPTDLAMPHVIGQSGDIVAILWEPRDALHAPAPPGHVNKILWVSRVPLAAPYPLVIRATLAGGTRTASATVPGGPGPSRVDMPVPGCWTFRLSWSGHTDELSLRYAP